MPLSQGVGVGGSQELVGVATLQGAEGQKEVVGFQVGAAATLGMGEALVIEGVKAKVVVGVETVEGEMVAVGVEERVVGVEVVGWVGAGGAGVEVVGWVVVGGVRVVEAEVEVGEARVVEEGMVEAGVLGAGWEVGADLAVGMEVVEALVATTQGLLMAHKPLRGLLQKHNCNVKQRTSQSCRLGCDTTSYTLVQGKAFPYQK